MTPLAFSANIKWWFEEQGIPLSCFGALSAAATLQRMAREGHFDRVSLCDAKLRAGRQRCPRVPAKGSAKSLHRYIQPQMALSDPRSSAVFSYDLEEFPDFYDSLVAVLTSGDDNARDELHRPLIERVLAANPEGQLCLVDLATGTGAVLASWMRLLGSLAPQRQALLVGTDISHAMLEAARGKLSPHPAYITLELIPAPMQFPLPDHLSNKSDLIYCAVGSFAHLVTGQEQIACLKSVKEALKPVTGIAAFEIMSLPDVGLRFPAEERKVVVPPIWQGIFEAPSTKSQGMTWKRRLIRQQLQEVGEAGKKAFLVAYDFNTWLSDDLGNVHKKLHDGWTLRYCSPGEFASLVAHAGLELDAGCKLPDEAQRTEDWLALFRRAN